MSPSFNTKQLSLIIVFSALGAIASVPIGHLWNYMKTLPFLPLGAGQILAGLHLIMVVLSALYARRPGAAAMTGAVKGLAEAVLFSFHGSPVIIMSAVQGAIIDVVLAIFGSNTKAVLVGCGLVAASNVVFIQFFLGNSFPFAVYVLMYALSTISGVVLGGYAGNKLFKMVEERLP